MEQLDDIILKAKEYVENNLPVSRPKDVYLTHVSLVYDYAVFLGSIYEADLQVLKLAALLHDIGADAGDVHADKSKELASDFLHSYSIPEEKLDKILYSIQHHQMNHNPAKYIETVDLETTLLRDADALAFLHDTYIGFFVVRAVKYGFEKAKKMTYEKIDGMLDKITTPEAKAYAHLLLNKAIEWLDLLSPSVYMDYRKKYGL